MSDELKPPNSLGSAAAEGKAVLGPRWPSAEAGLLGVCEVGKAPPPPPWVFSAGSRLRRRWLASLGLLLLLPMVLAGEEKAPWGEGLLGQGPSDTLHSPTHSTDEDTEAQRRVLASLGKSDFQNLSFLFCKVGIMMEPINGFLGTGPNTEEMTHNQKP